MGASYWLVGCFAGNYTLDLPSSRSQAFLCFSGIYEQKKLVELQLSRTASDVLSEFEVIIIDTAKIKSCFRQKTKPVLSKTLVSLDTPLVYDINADFGHRYLEFFLQDDGTNNPDSEAMEGKQNTFATLLMASQEAVNLRTA